MLTPAEIDSLLGVTGSKSKEKIDKLSTDAPLTSAANRPCFWTDSWLGWNYSRPAN